MDWTDSQIKETVQSIQTDSNVLSEAQIKEKYSSFIEAFPKLFYTCLDPGFNSILLDNMLMYRKKAKEENIPDLVRDATIGEEMAKKYLYPVVGEPTLEQKKAAAKKVVAKVQAQG